jgi:hypothetical protein
MKPFNFIARTPAAAIAVALFAAASLAACGSDSVTHNYPDTTPLPTPAPAPVPMIDAFFATVMSMIAASSDATEPVSIDALVTTSPENTEPEPVG